MGGHDGKEVERIAIGQHTVRRQWAHRRPGGSIVGIVFTIGGLCVAAGSSSAEVTSLRGSACGYYVNVGLFGGPQAKLGCEPQVGQSFAQATANTLSPSVELPAGGSASPITAHDADGAAARYGPAVIFGGRWPEEVASAPPSGPISVSTQGTTGPNGSVTSSVDIVLRSPANPASPGGFGPGPVEGDELHATCKATETSVTGSTRFVNGLLSTSTDVEGSPVDQEKIPDEPAPNYTRHGVITNVGDVFSVVFNEQIPNADGSLTVNAFHMYLFGPTAVGESVGGQVTCGTTPTTGAAKDTKAPICGVKVVAQESPDVQTPKKPLQELIGVADPGGLQSITNIKVTNGAVQVGAKEADAQEYLKFKPGQKGPLTVTATRTEEAENAGLPMTWSFDAIDAAGNTRHCDGSGSPAVDDTSDTTTTTVDSGATTTTQAGAATTTTTTTRPAATANTTTTTTTRPAGTATTTTTARAANTTSGSTTSGANTTATQVPVALTG